MNRFRRSCWGAVNEAQKSIQREAPGSGTTLTAALVLGQQITVAHVGDSRAYFVYPDGRIETVTRDQLLDEVWGYDSSPFTRTVDNHIDRLRQKIEPDPSQPKHIITVHRLGYRFIV